MGSYTNTKRGEDEKVKFLALMSHKDGAVDLEAFKEFSAGYQVKDKTFKRPKGVRIIEGGRVSGPYIIFIIYEAPNEKASRDFLRELEPYRKIERFAISPCGWCDRTKASQKVAE